MKKPYKIVSSASKSTPSSRDLADWLAKDGQLLLPLVALLEKGERAIDAVIDVMGRATIEAVLRMSAETVAGPKEQGRRDADRELYRHGVQGGRVALKDRQLRVEKPRLRKKRPRDGEPGEVEIPAYAALQADGRLADRMLELVLHGVSAREYETVLPAMADQAGVSKSEVSRETIESGTRVLRELSERDLSGLDVLVVHLDGIVFGGLPRSGGGGGGRRGPQARPGGARRGVGERGGDRGPAGGPGGAGSAGGPPASVRARRREGVAAGGRPGVRVFEPGAALPEPQGAERVEPSSEGAARAGAFDVAGGVEAGGRRGDSEAGAVCVVAGSAVAVGGVEPARGVAGAVHGQPPGAAAAAAPLSDDDERHRLVARGGPAADEPGEPLAEREDGGAVGGGDVPGDGEALPPDHRLRASLDAEGAPRRRAGRPRPCRDAGRQGNVFCRRRLSTTGGTPSESGHKVAKKKPGEPLRGRCDSFVVETDVHYPTDVNLLWDAMRRLLRETGRAAVQESVGGWRQWRHLTREVRNLFNRVRSTRRAKHHPERVSAYLERCRGLVERAEKTLAALRDKNVEESTRQVIEGFLAHARRQMDHVERRLVRGETVPHAEKVFSIFEEHTRWISRTRKAGS